MILPRPSESQAENPAPSSSADLGVRLAAQTDRLRFLCSHLAGRAILARVELDDLVQEVFLRVLARPESLPPMGEEGDERRLFGFLKGVAHHVVLDAARALRARKREGRETPLVHSDWSTAGVRAGELRGLGPGPATHAAGQETAEALLAAYRALAPDHRRVIGLRQFEGLSAAETGRRMGRSESAVHSLFRRALEAWDAAVR